MKSNVATSFVRKVLTLSHATFKNKNIQLIKEVLSANSYPKYVIEDIIDNVTRKLNENGQNQNITINNNANPQIKHTFSSMHYIPVITDNIKKNIKPILNNHRITCKPTKTLKNTLFTTSKQKIHKQNKAGVIYKVDCLNCDGCYIGQTGKKMGTRMQRHNYDYKNRFSLDSKTAAVTHAIDTGHQFDFSTATVLHSEQNKYKREIKETSNILIYNNTAVNRKTDLANLQQEYHNTLNIYSISSKISPLKRK